MKRIACTLVLALCLSLQWCMAQQTLLWSKGISISPGNSAYGLNIALDGSGNVLQGGYFSGTADFDGGPGVYTLTATGSSETFISKVDGSGNLIWVKKLTGIAGSNSSLTEMKLDASGNIYFTGYFTSTVDFDPGVGTFNMTSNGSYDVFVCKLDASGNFVWAKSVGETNLDFSGSIALDASGNVYVSGYYYNTMDFDPGPGTYTLSAVGQKESFILKLNSAGNFVWAKSFGSLYDDTARALAIDAAGNVWSVGYFADVVDFDPGPGTYTLSTGGCIYAGHVLKLSSAGNFLMAKAFTALSGYMDCMSVVLDPSGNLFCSGYFNATVDFDPGPGAFNVSSTGINDAYVVKMDDLGNLIWVKTLTGPAIEIGSAVTLDSDNNVYLCGNFQGPTDFDPNAGTHTLVTAGGDDAYICKLDANGNFLCASAMGGTGNDFASSIKVDAAANIYITGYFQDTADFDPGLGVVSLSVTGLNEPHLEKFTQFIAGAPVTQTLCAGSSLTLTGMGATTYSWMPGTGLSSTYGPSVVATPTISNTYTVIGYGCLRTSTFVTLNVVPKPVFTPAAASQSLYCIPDSILLQSSTSNTNAVLQWRKAISSTYYSQPFYARTPGAYYSKVKDVVTGCADSSLINVVNVQVLPNAKVTSHTYVNALTPLDTVTCYQPTVSITGASDTSGVTITWKSVANNSVFPNPVVLTAQNNLKLIVKRSDNGCSDSSLIVLVNQDNALPTIVTNTNNLELNCSNYTATLSANFNPPTAYGVWKSAMTYTPSNPVTTSTPGKYKFEVTNPANGCKKTDSVMVVQNNNLLLKTNSDTTVCKLSAANLKASAIGTLSGITYTWSTNQTANAIVVNPSATTYYTVNASGSGCSGSKVVKVIVPPDIQDSILAYRSCGENAVGSIVVFAKGGIAPYKYSINNGLNFYTSNSFTNAPFGNYTVVIKDSLGCSRSAGVTLDAGSNLPVPKFLASTKNYKSDTLVLVDVSVPKPDSVQWLLPPSASIIGGNMFNPIVAFSDTGSFVITMKGFYGSCIINATKLVGFLPYDSLEANYNNANGIKTFSLYPNPNNGVFTVFVEFYKKQNASIQVWDIGVTKHFQQNFYDVESITLPLSLTQLLDGGYLVRVIGEYDAKNKPFIISK